MNRTFIRKHSHLLLSGAFALLCSPASWAENIPVVKISADSTTLTFTCDDDTKVDNKKVYELNSGSNDPEWIPSQYAINNHLSERPRFTTVVFDPSFDRVHPKTMKKWFENCHLLTTFVGLQYLHTDSVTYMSDVFRDCKSLKTIDLSRFVTTEATDMSEMFYGCTSLEAVDLSTFNFSKVTTMSSMFNGCTALRHVNMGTSSNSTSDRYYRTNFSNMFRNCSSLQSLDISHLIYSANRQTSTVTAMIDGCTGLKYMFLGSNDPSMSDRFFESIGSTQEKPLTIFVTKDFDRTVMKQTKDGVYSYRNGYVRLGLQLDEMADSLPKATDNTTGILVKRAIKANTWSTLCLPFSMTARQVAEAFGADAKVADFTSMEEAQGQGPAHALTLNFNIKTDGIDANHPYLLYLTQAVDSFFVDSAAIANVAEHPGVTAEVQELTVTFRGQYNRQEVKPEEDQTIMFLSDNKLWIAPDADEIARGVTPSVIKGYRAYFQFVSPSFEAPQLRISIDGTTTGISPIDNAAPAARQLPAGVYNLSGQRVADSLSHLPKGVYITGGKKVVKP